MEIVIIISLVIIIALLLVDKNKTIKQENSTKTEELPFKQDIPVSIIGESKPVMLKQSLSTNQEEYIDLEEEEKELGDMFEIMRELNIRNGSITFNPDGSITAKGDEIDLKNKEAGEELESTKIKEENLQLSFDQNKNKTEEEDGKKVDREQFSWWGIVIGIFIFGVIYIIKRKLPWLGK